MLCYLLHDFFNMTGMAQFVQNFAEPGEPEYAPPIQEAETPVRISI